VYVQVNSQPRRMAGAAPLAQRWSSLPRQASGA